MFHVKGGHLLDIVCLLLLAKISLTFWPHCMVFSLHICVHKIEQETSKMWENRQQKNLRKKTYIEGKERKKVRDVRM